MIEAIIKQTDEFLLKPLASLAKVALRSRRPSPVPAPAERPERGLVIMGNGPSLRSFIEAGDEIRNDMDLLAVNFAAITPDFFRLRPQHYVLADPHFFSALQADPKVATLWQNLALADWPMTLWLPAARKKEVEKLTSTLPPCVRIQWINLTPIEGSGPLPHMLIKKGLGMPRPRNVMIPAIMVALRQGYRRIFLTGADHSWLKSLWVDDANHVVSVQPHFYKDNEKERERVQQEYQGYHLHDILQSMTIAFRSYFIIERFAQKVGAQIFNATPESFIDAFPRCDYAQMRQLSKP